MHSMSWLITYSVQKYISLLFHYSDFPVPGRCHTVLFKKFHITSHYVCSIWSTILQVSHKTTLSQTECYCSHTTTFSQNWFVPPNKIDFKTVFTKMKNLGDNLAVLLTLILIALLYIILLIVARHYDLKDIQKVNFNYLSLNWKIQKKCHNI